MAMLGMDISKLDTFSFGFFQDIKTLMDTLGKDTISRQEIGEYISERIKNRKEIPAKQKTVIRVKSGCKGCKDKKNLSKEEKEIQKFFEDN